MNSFRQLLMVIELTPLSRDDHVMWCNRTRVREYVYGTSIGEEEDTWQHEWQPLCLSALFLSQAFSLVSFPFTNLFLTFSLSLSLSRFTKVLNYWKETDRNHRISCIGGGAMTLEVQDN